MYVESGLGGYRARRGMGAAENPDTNVYFADGSVVPDDYGTTYGSVSGGTMPVQPFGTRATAWLNQNSTMVAVGAGVFVLAILFAKAGR